MTVLTVPGMADHKKLPAI